MAKWNKRNNKYNNKKVVFDGIKFDSRKEKNRYVTLKILEKGGYIENLKTQPIFLLQEAFRYNGKYIPKIEYKGDFEYYDKRSKITVIEDTKSEVTRKLPVYRIKMKWLLKTVVLPSEGKIVFKES